jgi:hypothetical protein
VIDHARSRLINQIATPKALQPAKAIHSLRVKLPGTPGTIFIRMIATLTVAPSHAIPEDSRSLG